MLNSNRSRLRISRLRFHLTRLSASLQHWDRSPPGSHADNRGLLSTVARSLKAGGRFALELPQKQPAIASLKPSDRFGDASKYTQVQRDYEAETDIVTEQFRLVSPARERTYSLRYRLFSPRGSHPAADRSRAAGRQHIPRLHLCRPDG